MEINDYGTPQNIDLYLCLRRNLSLSFTIGDNTKVEIVPYKAHFMITYINEEGVEKQQEHENTWDDAFQKFNDMCNTALNDFNELYIEQKTKENTQIDNDIINILKK